MMIPLGQFEITSGKMVVADPCYDLDPDTIIMGVLDRPLNGAWDAFVHKAEVRDWGEACAKLVACHSAYTDQQDRLEWVKCNFIVGVDSGQAGIFDASKYRIPDPEAPEPDTTDSEWYLACCDITGSETEAGVLDGGVVSHSGFGDGGYAAYAAADGEGRIIGVKIVFIKEADL
ncbi:DUF4241 domain-containing protein [Paenibacillus cookii]|jgi:hypothetical protein|uniref:DUF4241 domain-containing protein n=1 Tax=Paenibacillus cookii TaxID=157839 RepID=A0ABQ4M0B1_9BACL|nr:DUF4241 domain-containing protein [Paenibacillus cookii]GIO68970.1 hypothetical protein J21TS3_37910 [Paenibacillus cookii]